MQIISYIKKTILCVALLLMQRSANATNYTVNTKATLQSKMAAALPGDTVVVANGTYNNWGNISFTNTKGTSTSLWIVLKAQTINGVVFTSTSNLQFSGTHILVTGFKFAGGSTGGTTDVVQFRSSSTAFANYCRVTNLTFDNFNSDSTGAYLNNGSDIDNKWISLYGTNNRVDHCTFINKFNAGATITVWYDNNTYPQLSTPTYHRIDSNYFNGRGYLGANGGESMRIGVSTVSRSKGFNIIEYNLFENCSQTEPEIISNKSGFNTYRYNTFKNCDGGLTLRQGRYCNVYGNFFIVDNPARTNSYGIRVIDKGHKVYNNYIEGILGNKNKLSSLRCPIILYNGLSSNIDTTDPTKAAGYFPTDSVVVAFNTIVNCSGGGGIVLGFTDGGANIYQPKGIVIANNLIKMTTGQASYNDPANTALTYSAEGNFYSAPSLGLSSSTGFASKSLTFGARSYGILPPPSLVQDVATNTSKYSSLLNYLDVNGKTRTALFDVGCQELNGTGNIIASPLDSTLVGAGKPVIVTPVSLLAFYASILNNDVNLKWLVENEINFQQYEVEYSIDGFSFINTATIKAQQKSMYNYVFKGDNTKTYFRLKLVDKNGKFSYSNIIVVAAIATLNVYPNPVKDVINIHLKNTNLNTVLRIVDAAGKNIKQVHSISNYVNIPTAEFVNGMYNLQVIENNQILNSYPIIISK